MASLKSEPTCKPINRVGGLRLWMSSLPAQLQEHIFDSLDKPYDLIIILKALSGILYLKYKFMHLG